MTVYATETPCLEVDRLTVAYDSIEVVRGVSLCISAGEVIALLGPNGAGKTTLLLALAGLLRPSGGEIKLFGEPPKRQGHLRARQGLAFIGDDRNVFPSLSVRQNLTIVRRKADELLTLFPELAPKMKTRGALLSGGQQQMLALGRAMIVQPKLLIVDELSIGLAPIVRDRLLDNLREIADRGAAVLVVEQSVRSVLRVADRGYLMRRGEIVAHRSAQEWTDSFDELSRLFLS